ncbi:MAG: HAD family phosphatase [Clostridia bacterium]|nr:HAD family phosphatase [Clostridia bacterium]
MIFDIDGTLLDSMFIWETAGAVYLRSLGKEPQKDLQKVLKPLSLLQSAAYLKEHYAIPMSVMEIMDGINHTVEDFYFHTVMPKAGVLEWLKALAAQDMKMCIATATDRYQAEAALTRCGMRQYFSAIFTCTEVGSGKDQPLIFRKAMEHLGTERNSTVVVDDAFYAIQTAKSDGFMTVAICDSYEVNQDQLREMADVYLPDYHNLTPFWKLASAK